jgi:hypothetical protein
MNNGGRLYGIGLAALLLAGCHSKDDARPPSPAPTPSQSYGVSLTEVETTRLGDGRSLVVNGLPARGAELTVP